MWTEDEANRYRGILHRELVGYVWREKSMPEEDKTCARCGRRIAYRKKWARSWAEVRYCSDACRAARTSLRDRELEAAILTLLAARAVKSTICPSEAARAVGGEEWRDLMEPARQAARRLVARGEIVIVQQGHIVDPSGAKGPIRLRRA